MYLLVNFKNQWNYNMAKKEFKVGETFQCGLVKLKVEPSKKPTSCVGCFFWNENFPMCDDFAEAFVGKCDISRKDKTGVIFVKVEE